MHEYQGVRLLLHNLSEIYRQRFQLCGVLGVWSHCESLGSIQERNTSNALSHY